jgi:hypothetical protein
LKSKLVLAVGVEVIVLFYHFLNRVAPGFNSSWSSIDCNRSLPYLIAAISIVCLVILKLQRNKSYQEFIDNSPGKDMKSSDIQYGTGHGFSKKSSEGESECHVIAENNDG